MNKDHADLQGARILLVDDQPANLDVLYELLNAAGYRIFVAPNGPVALKVVEQAEPDLILLDVRMPGMNGYEVCQKLKQDEKTQDIPVIFITAENQTEGVVAGFQAGGVDYITKPFRDEEVLVRVRTHLRLNRLQRELETKSDALEEKNQSLEAANQALAIANQQIQEANQHKSEFLARMSHGASTGCSGKWMPGTRNW
jgi:DNA-binding response OmpR family regulator